MITHYMSCQPCRTVSNSVNSVNSVNSYSAVLPPSPMVFLYCETCRRYEELYKNLLVEDLDGIYKKTGCLKPCHYLKYWVEGDGIPTTYKSDHFLFSLVSVSNNTYVETEMPVYPWTSFVAEFGGSLGLFLGVSFMSLWDGIHVIQEAIHNVQELRVAKFLKYLIPSQKNFQCSR